MDFTSLAKVTFSDQLILTTEQLAEFYGCNKMKIIQNFNNNKNRFVEGKHYFKVEGDALKAFKSHIDTIDIPINKFASVLYLWTKRGAARHAKMLSTDRAWQVFENLEDTYFDVKEKINSAPKVEKKAAAEKIIIEKPVIVEKQVVVEKPVVVPNQPLPKYHEFAKEIFRTARIIHHDSGLDYNLCVLTVTEMMEEKYGIDLTHIKNLFPVEDPEIEYYTPTQIGKLVGKKNGTIKYSAKRVNKILIKLGLQEKDIKGNYILTEPGKNYGVAIPYFNNGRTGLQVKWSDKVLELF